MHQNQHLRNKHRKHIDFIFHKIYQKSYVLASWLAVESTSQSTGSSSRSELLSLDKHCVKIRKLGTAKLVRKGNWAWGCHTMSRLCLFLLDDNAPGKKIKHMDMCTPVFPFWSTTRSSSLGCQTSEWVCSLHLMTLLLYQTDLPWFFYFTHPTCPSPQNSRKDKE